MPKRVIVKELNLKTTQPKDESIRVSLTEQFPVKELSPRAILRKNKLNRAP